MNWYGKKPKEIESELETSIEKGLTSQQAEERIEKYGENKLSESKKKPFYKKLLEQLLDPMVLILIVAAVLSSLAGDLIETIIIIAIVILNATMSLIQEGKAEDSVAALQKMSSPDAKVLRDGNKTFIKSDRLVPGDIVYLETGDIVPADLRLIESSNLQIDESSLTGESVPVNKDYSVNYDEEVQIGDRKNYCYSSTIVTYGRAVGVVTETGHGTEIGHIATKIQSYENEQTPLQEKLNKLSKILGILVIAISILVFVIGLLRPDMDILESLMTAVSLSVAAIPEGLAAVVTIVLSIGMNRMAKKNAIVKKLLAVETLGTTTVICSDKTGTLTQNEMTVTKAFANGKEYDVDGTGYDPNGHIAYKEEEISIQDELEMNNLVHACMLNNDSKLIVEEGVYGIVGDPTEGALISFGEKTKLKQEDLNQQFPRIAELPFDSTRKMMTTFHENYYPDAYVAFTKGAPDIIIDRCKYILKDGQVVDFTDDLKKETMEMNSRFAKSALRVLAYAFNRHDSLPDQLESDNIEKDLIFIGLTGMIDPPRPEVREAIKECKSAGILPIMITGDYLDTALAIAKDLGIAEDDDQAMMGKDLSRLSEEEIREIVKHKRVFARVSPENKVQIVTALKDNGEIAAMTGDGVNDAPAIKKADIGIAMGITGTDVAKNTADVILTDDNFATIVEAVEEGRIIYSNIKKFVSFLLSCNMGEVIVMLVAMLAGAPVPLTVIQLLWLNLVTDSFPALALGVEQGEKDIMSEKPRNPGESILDKEMRNSIIVQSIAIGVATLGAFFLGQHYFFPIDPSMNEAAKLHALNGARTMAFVTLVFAELLRAFSVRSNKYTVKELGLFTNMHLVKAVLLAVVLMVVILYIPALEVIFETVNLGVKEWIAVLLLAFVPFTASEVHKIIKR